MPCRMWPPAKIYCGGAQITPEGFSRRQHLSQWGTNICVKPRKRWPASSREEIPGFGRTPHAAARPPLGALKSVAGYRKAQFMPRGGRHYNLWEKTSCCFSAVAREPLLGFISHASTRYVGCDTLKKGAQKSPCLRGKKECGEKSLLGELNSPPRVQKGLITQTFGFAQNSGRGPSVSQSGCKPECFL